MKREEFLSRLRSGLDRLPPDELENVLDYYNEIFLDAGVENEEQTAKNLGSVDDIIRQTYADNNIDPDGRPEYYVGGRFEDADERDGIYDEDSRFGYNNNYTGSSFAERNEQPQPKRKASDRVFSMIGKLALLVLLFPIWFPLILVAAILVLVFVLVGGVLAFVLGICGGAIVIGGIFTVIPVPPVGLAMIGAGLMIIGIFSMIALPSLKGTWKGFAALCRKISNSIHNLLFNREVR